MDSSPARAQTDISINAAAMSRRSKLFETPELGLMVAIRAAVPWPEIDVELDDEKRGSLTWLDRHEKGNHAEANRRAVVVFE